MSYHHPIGDFGNYYYGSKFFREGISPLKFYQDIHFFNEKIKQYEPGNFFENYGPVPPFSLIFYYPLTFLQIHNAKFIFNVISLIVLCFSLFRYLKSGIELKYYHMLIIPVLLFPMYINFVQGQAYLLVVAAILEIYIAYLQKKNITIAFLVALLFLLKVFPVFIVLFFILKKEYKIILLSLSTIALFLLLTYLLIGIESWLNYYTNILPRLFRNEIIDPFYYGHQSLNILLKNVFYRDEISNPSPLINLPFLALIIESCFIAFIIGFTYVITKTKDGLLAFSLTILFGLISGKYITSYSLLLFLPFLCSLNYFKNKSLIILIAFLICNVPVTFIPTHLFPLKFFRIFLMILLVFLIYYELKPKLNYKLISASLLLLISFGALSVKRFPNNYFLKAQKAGVYFNLEALNDKIIIERCMGSQHYIDTIISPVKINKISRLNCNKNIIINSGKIIALAGLQNLQKAWLVNDTTIIYLSDLQQGVGFYKLRLFQNTNE